MKSIVVAEPLSARSGHAIDKAEVPRVFERTTSASRALRIGALPLLYAGPSLLPCYDWQWPLSVLCILVGSALPWAGMAAGVRPDEVSVGMAGVLTFFFGLFQLLGVLDRGSVH